MSAAPLLSTHALDDIADFMREHYRRPRWPLWMGHMPAAFEDLKVGAVPVGRIAKGLHKLTETWRYSLATWEWLRPATPTRTLAELPGLQQMCGLDHVHPTAFAAHLAELAAAVGRDHPPLRLWVALRIALLEYATHPPSAVTPDDHKISAMLLRNATLRAQSMVPFDEKVAIQLASKILRQAMDGAADAAKTAFGAEDCALSANLMIPLRDGHPPFEPNELARENSRRALELWGVEYADTKRLVIVAETHGSKHLGFWIPAINGQGGATLPGAAAAYTLRDGGVVFKDDLPPLTGFPPALQERWRSYMEHDFTERLFFSLPFRVPRPTGGRVAAAVLNVNVDARDLGIWRRAYHREWLCVARDRAEPFIEMAYAALRIILTQQPVLFLDSGSDEWDRLEPVLPRKQIRGAT